VSGFGTNKEAAFWAAVAGSKVDWFSGPLARVGEGRGNRGSVRGHHGWCAPKGRGRGREKRMCWLGVSERGEVGDRARSWEVFYICSTPGSSSVATGAQPCPCD
jgi:hypothetical protein